MLKAIETHYKGYRFRSRLEARWAVFFDALGVPWEYEKEGYDLGEAGWYLPDFWLPEQRCWFEVKGEFDQQGIDKVSNLCAQARKEIHIGSTLDINEDIATYVPLGIDKPMPLEWMLNLLQPEIWIGSRPGTEENHKQKDVEDIFNMLFVDPDIGFIELKFKGTAIHLNAQGFALCSSTWMECELCHKVFIMTKPVSWHLPCDCGKGGQTKRIQKAYNAARSARFEHGERP